MYGAASYSSGSTLKLGAVVQVSYASTQNGDNVNLYDMVLTNYVALLGDSGGTVFCMPTTGSYRVTGTQSRVFNSGTNSIYAKAVNSLNALGVSTY